MSGVMKTVLQTDSRCNPGADIKIKRNVSPLFLPPLVYLPVIAVLSLLLAFLHGLKAALKCSEIKVKYG